MNTSRKTVDRINWTNTLFLFLTPIIAVIGTTILIVQDKMHVGTALLAFALFVLVGMSITCGYHRLFSHQAYKATWPVRLFWALFGAAAFEGSILEWCTDHRNHHRYTDTDRDPYDIKKGFWYAHMGWLLRLDTSKRDFSNVKDLEADPIVRFQHRFFIPLATLMTFGLPTVIAALWGDAWGGLIIAGFLRIVITQQSTFCINSVCHIFGKRTYKEQSARDHWFTALFTFGEGYHNFHHQFALDYRNGVRSWDFDPAKWLIFLMSYVGMASNLKRVSEEKMIRYRIHAEEKKILNKLQTQSGLLLNNIINKLTPLRERILEVAVQVEKLEKNYQALKEQRMSFITGKMSEYRLLLQKERETLKKAQRDLKHALINWRYFIRHRVHCLPA